MAQLAGQRNPTRKTATVMMGRRDRTAKTAVFTGDVPPRRNGSVSVSRELSIATASVLNTSNPVLGFTTAESFLVRLVSPANFSLLSLFCTLVNTLSNAPGHPVSCTRNASQVKQEIYVPPVRGGPRCVRRSARQRPCRWPLLV